MGEWECLCENCQQFFCIPRECYLNAKNHFQPAKTSLDHKYYHVSQGGRGLFTLKRHGDFLAIPRAPSIQSDHPPSTVFDLLHLVGP